MLMVHPGIFISFCCLVYASVNLMADEQKVAAEPVCIVNVSQINEGSGLAVSSTHPGSFWMHNDAGDAP